MKKKIVSICLVLAILAVAVTGTLAYLTDEDQALNTMTLGDIEIEQTEWQRVVDENGNFVIAGEAYGNDYPELEAFEQDKLMLPATGKHAFGNDWVAFEQWDGTEGYAQMTDKAAIGNSIDKIVTVKNTGDNDVYYRTIIVVEDPTGIDHTKFDQEYDLETIDLNVNGNSRFDWNQSVVGNQNGSNAEKIYDVMIGGVRHYAIVATYTEKLVPGEYSRASLLEAYMQKEVNNDDYELFGDKVTILAYTQAVQADGWSATADKTAAQVALEEAFGSVTKESIEALDWDLTDFVA